MIYKNKRKTPTRKMWSENGSILKFFFFYLQSRVYLELTMRLSVAYQAEGISVAHTVDQLNARNSNCNKSRPYRAGRAGSLRYFGYFLS